MSAKREKGKTAKGKSSNGKTLVEVFAEEAKQKEQAMRESIAEFNEEALFCDGHDHALIGVALRFGMPPVAAYDYEAIIKRLMNWGSTREEAEEFFEFNVVGAWVGENTPLFVRDLRDER